MFEYKQRKVGRVIDASINEFHVDTHFEGDSAYRLMGNDYIITLQSDEDTPETISLLPKKLMRNDHATFELRLKTFSPYSSKVKTHTITLTEEALDALQEACTQVRTLSIKHKKPTCQSEDVDVSINASDITEKGDDYIATLYKNLTK